MEIEREIERRTRESETGVDKTTDRELRDIIECVRRKKPATMR
jgi:hypothetical protein